ncbi:MAG TPA: alpha,alpha-trehalase TreF [Cyclobacteriaceae bacterium]
MKTHLNHLTIVFLFSFLISCQQTEKASTNKKPFYPEKDLNEVFVAVQSNEIFRDSKTFVDAIPKREPLEIVNEFNENHRNEGFDLKAFVLANFEIPEKIGVQEQEISVPPEVTMEEHIEALWDQLKRKPDETEKWSSKIPLPYPYIVPGGRFREIYYWDSYFTMIGLAASGRLDLVRSMIDNFAYLIDEMGFIPNGNRTYYRGRSQPPFFSSMVMLLAKYEGTESVTQYLPHLEKEYEFWMAGRSELTTDRNAKQHVVLIDGRTVLNRYWGKIDEPRPEAYVEDIDLSMNMDITHRKQLFIDLRAAAESGWDFSTRWFEDSTAFQSIQTTEILPVDLNCLLYHLETSIAKLHNLSGNDKMSGLYNSYATQRKAAILRYFWNEDQGYFTDYHWVKGQLIDQPTLAGMYPLYFNIATDEQAASQAALIKEKFLMPGGVTTTLVDSDQQWDYPNGWAPLQWITIKGLAQYDILELSKEIKQRWLRINRKVFRNTGKMMEKYNVVDTTLIAGGGEYPTQDGFGWTNGVATGLLRENVNY